MLITSPTDSRAAEPHVEGETGMVKNGQSQSMKKFRAGLTNNEFLTLLAGSAAEKRWGQSAVRERIKSLSAQLARLNRLCCSVPWREDNWTGTEMIVELERKTRSGFRVRICKLVSAPYPPGGCQTLMRSCRSGQDRNHPCHCRLFPPQFITTSGHCLTCHLADLAESKVVKEMHEAGILTSQRTGSIINERLMRKEQASGRDYQGGLDGQ